MHRGMLALVCAAVVACRPGVADATPTSGLTAISAGFFHTCALTTAGAALCWGQGNFGALGNGDVEDHSAPTPVTGLSSGVASIVAGGSHTCAVTNAGGLKCWGNNLAGELGDGTTQQRNEPQDVPGLASGIAAVTLGGHHTCALTTVGGVKCWGSNFAGQLGDGTTNERHVPGDVPGLTSGVAAISAGEYSTCALTVAGGVKCWGQNTSGQLGDGTIIVQQAPTDPSGRPVPADVLGLTNGAAQISAGWIHTCAALANATAKCWGDNYYGELGDGTTENRLAPADVISLVNVVSVSAGTFYTCALTAAGGVKCWGAAYGVGDVSPSTPADIQGLASGVIALSAGNGHACVLKSDQTASCWGANTFGQLGNSTYDFSPVPTTVGARTGQMIMFAPLANHGISDAAPTLSATATSGLPVSFSSLTPQTCTVAGSTVTLDKIGICTVAADQSGDADYAPAPGKTQSFLISGITASSPTRLANISTRGQVLTGYDIMIGGFVIGGLAPKTVVVRAIGPSLVSSGVANPLADPRLDLYAGQHVYRSVGDWQNAFNADLIQTLGFAPSDPRESVILVTLNPGAYTAVVSGNGGTGVGLVEVYEIDREDVPLINISTRGYVGASDDVMIGGFVITGNSPQTVVVTAKGPTLGSYDIPNPLANPTLTLVKQSDHSIIATNDDWGSAPNASAIQASGFAPSNSLESAILVTLPPGAYTAIVSGVGGGTGTGIVEVYATQ